MQVLQSEQHLHKHLQQSNLVNELRFCFPLFNQRFQIAVSAADQHAEANRKLNQVNCKAIIQIEIEKAELTRS